jgi:hypothetical protein
MFAPPFPFRRLKTSCDTGAHVTRYRYSEGLPATAFSSKPLIPLTQTQVGAGGGTRTHTTFYGPRILSPVRLPFRHTGNLMFAILSVSLNDGSVDVVLLLQHANQFNFKQLDQPR